MVNNGKFFYSTFALPIYFLKHNHNVASAVIESLNANSSYSNITF
jgi:hypothetical protein